jgi:hypothetical protein
MAGVNPAIMAANVAVARAIFVLLNMTSLLLSGCVAIWGDDATTLQLVQVGSRFRDVLLDPVAVGGLATLPTAGNLKNL